MKKTTHGTGAVAIGLAVLMLSAVSAPAEQRPGFETYVVRSGDTLSKISRRVFGDEKRWREILKENPQVTNANRIFPGDTLLVPLSETATAGARGGELAASAGADAGTAPLHTELATAPPATGEQGSPAPSGLDATAGTTGAAEAGTAPAAASDTAAPAPTAPMEQVRSVAVVNPTLYRNAGSIADKLPTIAIVASQDDQILLGSGDAAIINAPFPPGTRFTVVRAARRVYHPRTRKNLGWLVRILGTAEVTCRGQRTSTVVLRGMNDTASVGDYLLPVDPNDVLEKNVLADKGQPVCIPPGTSDGVIVAFNEDRITVGEQELAYIDRGTASGAAPGQRFTIYREIAPEGRVDVGELQILRVGEHTATALITTSVQEVQVGFMLRAH